MTNPVQTFRILLLFCYWVNDFVLLEPARAVSPVARSRCCCTRIHCLSNREWTGGPTREGSWPSGPGLNWNRRSSWPERGSGGIRIISEQGGREKKRKEKKRKEQKREGRPRRELTNIKGSCWKYFFKVWMLLKQKGTRKLKDFLKRNLNQFSSAVTSSVFMVYQVFKI